MNWLVVGTLGVFVIALAVWGVALQNKIADFRTREQQLLEQLSATQRTKATDAVVGTPGFHDLSFSDALKRAEKDGKPVMALFLTETSGPSMAMEEATWKDRTVRDWLRANTVAVRINADQEPDLAVANNITGLPVMIFFMPDGKEIGRVVGYQPAQHFLREATAVVNRMKK